MSPGTFFLLALKASLLSNSGLGNVPILHADLVTRGAASERHFAEALAVGQISPGPNGLWVISLGYLLHGLPGALWGLLAVCLPPLLVLGIDRLYRKVQHHAAVEGFVRGLSLAVVAVFAVVLLEMLRAAGLNPRTIVITVASLALGASRRVPLIGILLIAALVGILWR